MPLGPWPLAWRPPGRLLEAEGGLPRGPPTLVVEDWAGVVFFFFTSCLSHVMVGTGRVAMTVGPTAHIML